MEKFTLIYKCEVCSTLSEIIVYVNEEEIKHLLLYGIENSLIPSINLHKCNKFKVGRSPLIGYFNTKIEKESRQLP